MVGSKGTSHQPPATLRMYSLTIDKVFNDRLLKQTKVFDLKCRHLSKSVSFMAQRHILVMYFITITHWIL